MTEHSGHIVRLTVCRQDPSLGSGLRYETYELECTETSTILDLLNDVRDNHDSTLAYRYACRIGKCDICTAMVNGRFALTCMRQVGDATELVVRARAGRPVLRDLVAADRRA